MNAILTDWRVAVRSGHKVGKALGTQTIVPTPDGWKTMGDLAVGDVVFAEDGRPCNVTGVSEVQYDRECFEVEFDDGTVIVADAEHLWTTWDSQVRRARDRGTLGKRCAPKPVTTKHISQTLMSKSRGRNHAIPTAEPCVTREAFLPIDPYVLGVWLGNGHKSGSVFCTPDEDVVRNVEAAGYMVTRHGAEARPAEPGEYSGGSAAYGLRHRLSNVPFIAELRGLNLYGNKHIPPVYLRGSIEQRRALLSGLMDTDGFCNTNGSVEFTNTNRNIADGVYELACSLGFKVFFAEGRAMLNGEDYGPKWRVYWTPHEPVFRTERKLARQHTGKTKAQWVKQRMVVDVRPTASVPVRCIAVDSPSHLFLVSKAFIPTHNSVTAVCAALWFGSVYPRARVILTAPTHRQIRSILWRELKHLYHNSEIALGGNIAELPEIGLQWEDGREIVGFYTNEPEKMAGISGPHVLFIVDEASGIPVEIYEAIEGNRAGGARLVMFSNPTQTSGYFYDAFNEKREFWKCIHVSSEEAAEQGIKGVGLATQEYIDEKKKEWGEDNPLYHVRIKGVFPAQAENAIIGLALVEEAVARWTDLDESNAPLSLGVDVARFGDDDSAIAPRRGKKVFQLQTCHGQDTQQIAGFVMSLVRKLRHGPHERVLVNVDVIGVGAGVADALREFHKKREIVLYEVNVSEVARNEEEYPNLRSELWFKMEKFLKDGGAIPDDAKLIRELVAPVYTFDRKGRRQVEPKDDLKKRLGRSPDRADAACLSLFGDGAERFRASGIDGRNDISPGRRNDEDDPDTDVTSVYS